MFKKKLNILIIGFGSIGQRHYRNLNQIFKKNINFFLLRKKYKVPLLDANNNIKKYQKNSIPLSNILKSLNEIKLKKLKIDAAFICNPSSMHMKYLIWLLKNNINTFVEKPLSNNLKRIPELEKILKKTSAISMIGYQMRFNPIIKFLSVEKNCKIHVGKINFVQINNGEDVRTFHPWEDYKTSYTSKKNLGGGVTLSQIHEFDYFNLLFKNYKIVDSKSIVSKISDMNIDVDDTSSHIFKLNKQKSSLICTINLNFYQKPKSRTIKYIGDKGTLIADLNKKHLKIFKKKKVLIKKFKFSRNDLFLKELVYFFNCIKNNKKNHDIDIYSGIRNLRFVVKLMKN